MIAKGNKSTDIVAKVLYEGIGAVKVMCLNPSKETLEKIYNRTIDNEPVYVSESEIEGKKIPSARITFLVKTVAEKNNGIDMIANHTFFIQRQYVKGSNSGKFQVIDKYGRTAWATPYVDFKIENGKFEVIQIPQYGNGPASIDIDYRPCYVGEEDVTSFLKNYLNISNIQKWDNNIGKYVDNDKVDPTECQIRLDSVEDYFKGNFKELQEAISYQPENVVKIAFGVKTEDNNKQTQVTYPRWSAKANTTDYSKFATEIVERKNKGALANVEYDNNDLHEYVIETSIPTPNNGDSFVTKTNTKNPWQN